MAQLKKLSHNVPRRHVGLMPHNSLQQSVWDRPCNDLLLVGWDAKPYLLIQSVWRRCNHYYEFGLNAWSLMALPA